MLKCLESTCKHNSDTLWLKGFSSFAYNVFSEYLYVIQFYWRLYNFEHFTSQHKKFFNHVPNTLQQSFISDIESTSFYGLAKNIIGFANHSLQKT